MKKVSLILILLFTSGCSFNGIMPQTYDDETLTKSEADISDYQSAHLINTEDIDERYPFTLSEEVLGKSDLEGEGTTISPGTYTAGEDIEPGEYSLEIAAMDAGGITVSDSSGVRLLELAVNYNLNQAVVDLKEGFEIEFKARSGTLTLEPAVDRDTGNEVIYLPAGMTEAGVDIPEGSYYLISGFLPLMRSDGHSEVYVNYEGRFAGQDQLDALLEENSAEKDDIQLVELYDGDMIVSEEEVILKKE